MSSTPSITDASTISSIDVPRPGILWSCVSIKDSKLTPQMVDDWYEEHIPDVLNSGQGSGGLFLRYRNVDPLATPDFDMSSNLASRLDPASPGDEVQQARWPYLAIVKVLDQDWYHSQAWKDIPRSSTRLNPDPHGAPASAFDTLHVGLRAYINVGGSIDPGEQWPSYFIGLQTSSVDEDVFEHLTNEAKKCPGFRGAVRYKLTDLEWVEPGKLPPGFITCHFEGSTQPEVEFRGFANVVKQDIWRLTVAEGDTSLSI